jgi:Na+-transporting NADH:ubiquinone oxidoreductase subunit F
MAFLPFVLLSTAVFSGIIFLLIMVLVLVESRVARKGDCRVTVNDAEKPLMVGAGKNLLMALAHERVFLPSACGGGGTCALCKCQVLQGGGDVLPTETGLLTRREQKEHLRLACQVKVRDDLVIRVPEEVFNVKKFTCAVRSNNNVAAFIKELVLELPEPLDFKAGGYIQIYVPPYRLGYRSFDINPRYHPDWDKEGLRDLNAENDEETFRAYSMASHPGEKGLLLFNVRIAPPPPRDMSLPPGIASSYIFNLKPGDRVEVSGPYGEFFIKDTKKEMIYIGGGAGMAPLRSHLMFLFRALKTLDRRISYWYGARSARDMFYAEEFKAIEREFPNFSFTAALSEPLAGDHWEGPAGFIHQVLYDQYLKNHEEPEEVEYYLCGPPAMIDAALGMLDSLGVPPEMISHDKFG